MLRRYVEESSSPTEEEKARAARERKEREEIDKHRHFINDVAQVIKEGTPVPCEFVAKDRRVPDDVC